MLAFGLAACGSSSDNDTAETTPPVVTPDPMPMEPVAVTIPDTPMGHAAMAGMLSIPEGGSATSGGVMFSCADGGGDCEVTVADDGTASATGDVMAALTADAQKASEDEQMTAAVMARDRIIGKDRALEQAMNLPAATDAAMTVGEANILISRGPSAMARVRVINPTGYTASDMMAPANGDWAGTRLMRSVTGATQHLFVYTDIESPTRIQFYDFDGVATTPSLYDSGDDAPVTAPNDGYSPDVAPLPLPLVGLMTRGNLDAKFMSPGDPEDGDVTQRFPVAATLNSTSFQGNYNGAPGRTLAPAAATMASPAS